MLRPGMLRRDDTGNILISVILVSMLVGALGALTLKTGEQATRTSTSDRNSELALGVAESGLHDVITRINDKATAPTTETCNVFGLAVNQKSTEKWPTAGCFATSTPQGTYDVIVKRTLKGFELDAQAKAGGTAFGRNRHVKMTLSPPELFPPGDHYALFSWGMIDLKNNDNIMGDVWANSGAILMDKDAVKGSVTSAQSYIDMKNSMTIACDSGPPKSVCGNVWTGGPNTSSGNAIDLAGASVGGWAKASSGTANCTNDDEPTFKVNLGGGSVGGNVTALGTVIGGTNYASKNENTCTTAPTPKTGRAPTTGCTNATGPCFTFNKNNYDPATLHEFPSVADFKIYLDSNKTSLVGTFVIDEPAPNQTAGHFVDLDGAKIIGDTTIVTNAPVDTNGVDQGNTTPKIFTVVSRYTPYEAGCDDQGGDCSIQAKNNFQPNADGTCATNVLLYAETGPIAMKNNAKMCGSAIGSNVFLKNNLDLAWDDSLYRIVGFGQQTLEIIRWEELPER